MRKNFMMLGTILSTTMLFKAKDNENPEAGAQATPGQNAEKSNEDGIESEIDKGVSLENTADEAAALIAKENKDRRIEETKNILLKSAYIRSKQLLVVRRDKRRGAAGKDYLKALSTLDEELKAGKHDKTSFNKGFNEAYKKRDDALREIDKTYNEYGKKLKNLYPSSWSYDWDYTID